MLRHSKGGTAVDAAMVKPSQPHKGALYVAYVTAAALFIFGLLVLLVGFPGGVIEEGMTQRWVEWHASPFGWVPLILGLIALGGLATRRFALVWIATTAMIVLGIPLIFNVGIVLILGGAVLAISVCLARRRPAER
jgi:hypothetical protein